MEPEGLLIGIFLMSIGMTLDWHIMIDHFWLVLGVVFGLAADRLATATSAAPRRAPA